MADALSVSTSAYVRATETAEYVRSQLPEVLQKPKIAIVCGSGLGGLAETIESGPKVELAYATIPNFPQSTEDACSLVGWTCTVSPPWRHWFQDSSGANEASFYEGHSMDAATFATRVCKLLGVETIIGMSRITLQRHHHLTDVQSPTQPAHLFLAGLTGVHPLRGPNIDEFGVRFPPLSDAYDLDLRRRTHKAWKQLGLDQQERRLHEGVYAFVAGPTYETRAECRALTLLGADVVGMSTVPEIIVARHAGMRVLAFSLVTNVAVLEAGPRGDDAEIQSMSQVELTAHLSKGMANHQEVLDAGREAAKDMQALVKQIASDL
ncbi:hypothetical protein IAQ61_011651 [Plenodomus lingam]|uniref:uncharacterized protein n=1 Tax=Leptosphaeria maculans TaxID=5022 RepID=UPI00333443B2|nr:hypothetical protein IAQ61_011651 [Plenodomus lingam]